MTPAFRYTLLWLAGSLLMIIAALSVLSASYAGGEFGPSNGDAFYHAARILDSLFSGDPVVQFDPRIHAPEGSWLVWPWGYDTLMTQITRMFGPFANEAAANRVLMNIPPAMAPIAVALVVVIARQLSLSFFQATLLVLGFAGLPLAFVLFSVGNIDHHFAELLWTLALISAGMAFFRAVSAGYGAGIGLGCVLGSAMAIHNGLFILQIPVVAALGLTWLRGETLPHRRQVMAFAASLALVALLVCVPSVPWQRGFFEFYTLSWFHLYIAGCVAVFSVVLALMVRSPRNIALVAIAALLALLPIFNTFRLAGEFVSGDLAIIRNIFEAHSPYELHAEFGARMSTQFFSWLLWLSGPMAVLNLWWAFHFKEPGRKFMAIVGVFGLTLMQAQYRFAVFGELSMILTPVLAASLLSDWRPQWRRAAMGGCLVLFAVASYPTWINWQTQWVLGASEAYLNVRSTFPELKKDCAARPGIVVADVDSGHWIRYHSRCSVIANVFLLTPQHTAKVVELERLMSLSPAQLLVDRVPVRYVFAHHSLPVQLDEDGQETPRFDEMRQMLMPLEAALLGPEAALPSQFKKRWEVTTPAGQIYARLYEIERTQ
jgi:hypothetical protein